MKKIIDGKKIAKEILEELKHKVDGKEITLAVILIGENPASKIYVNMKKKACEDVGIKSKRVLLKEETSEESVIEKILELNSDKNIHGILVQLPLPKHIDQRKIIETIDPKKDIDGFHPINVGRMFLGDEDIFFPCTPNGIKILLERANVEVEGKHVVIVGRSNIVGKPLAAILMQNRPGCNATVTVAHSKSKNLKEVTRSADILVAAVGRAKFIKRDMVKEGAVVIDVGINREKGSKKIYGDVDFEDIFEKVSKITPVPGAVGPMTIASLLLNTYRAFEIQRD